MNDAPQRRFWPRRVSWLTIILALAAVISFFAISTPGSRYVSMMGNSGGGVGYNTVVPPMPAGVPMRDESGPTAPQTSAGKGSSAYYPEPYPYYKPDVPVSDARELLKMYYNATMYTRDVQGLTRRIETSVRGHEGRIDQESMTERSGYVSFALPQAKYDAFRAELEGMVDSRFLTINISSQNLLPQKQNIEEQQKQADTSLSDYQTARQKLVSTHANTVQSLQSQIDADTAKIASLNAQASTPQVQAQLQSVLDESASLKKQLASENASYTAQLSSADANIKYAKDWQKAVQTQDQALLDSVATVTGTVSVQWISYWDMAQKYLPGYWIPAIFVILAFLSLLFDRRRFGTV